MRFLSTSLRSCISSIVIVLIIISWLDSLAAATTAAAATTTTTATATTYGGLHASSSDEKIKKDIRKKRITGFDKQYISFYLKDNVTSRNLQFVDYPEIVNTSSAAVAHAIVNYVKVGMKMLPSVREKGKEEVEEVVQKRTINFILEVGADKYASLHKAMATIADGLSSFYVVIDPDPTMSSAMSEYIELNNKKEISMHNLKAAYITYAVGDEDNQVQTFYRLFNESNGETITNAVNIDYFQTKQTCKGCAIEQYKAESKTLDSILSDYFASLLSDLTDSTSAITLLRLDMAGSELKALKGLKKTAAKYPNMLIAVKSYMLPVYGPATARHTEISLEMEKLNFAPLDFVGKDQLMFNYLELGDEVGVGATEGGVGVKSNNMKRSPLTVSQDVLWARKDRVVYKAEHSELKEDSFWSDRFVMKCIDT